MWISKDLKLVKKIQGLQRPPWAQDTNWMEKPNVQPRWGMQPVSPLESPPVIPQYEAPPTDEGYWADWVDRFKLLTGQTKPPEPKDVYMTGYKKSLREMQVEELWKEAAKLKTGRRLVDVPASFVAGKKKGTVPEDEFVNMTAKYFPAGEGEQLSAGEEFIGEWIIPAFALMNAPTAGAIRPILQSKIATNPNLIYKATLQAVNKGLIPVELAEKTLTNLLGAPFKFAKKALEGLDDRVPKLFQEIKAGEAGGIKLPEGEIPKKVTPVTPEVTPPVEKDLLTDISGKINRSRGVRGGEGLGISRHFQELEAKGFDTSDAWKAFREFENVPTGGVLSTAAFKAERNKLWVEFVSKINQIKRITPGVTPKAPKPVIGEAPPVEPPVIPSKPVVKKGKLWLPEPPRTPVYMEFARKELPGSFRKKEGALDIVEQAHQQVLKSRDMGENVVPYVMSYVHQTGDVLKSFGVDAVGMVTKVKNPNNLSLAINDVLSNYTRYGLTSAQKKMAEQQGFIYKEALRLAKRYDVKISELGKPDELWQYIARKVKAIRNPVTGLMETPPPTIGGFRMGAKISSQKERTFDEMLQGIDLGFLYENPDQVMAHHIRGIYRLIGNKQAENTVLQLTRAITKKEPLRFGERAIAQPALQARASNIEVANAIDKIFGVEHPSKILKTGADISGAIVGQIAALDISAPFIQGFPLLGHDIKRGLAGKASTLWLRSYGRMWKSVFNRDAISGYRNANPDLYKRAIESGVMTGQSEFVSGVPVAERALGKIPVVGKTLKSIYAHTWGRMGGAYSDFLEISRVKYFEQMEQAWLKNGGNIYELGALANRMLGSVSAKARGISINRSYAERIGAFAPNYLRSAFLLLGDLAKGGMKAKEVATTLSALLGVGAAFYYAEEKLRGREPKMKPWPKRLGGDGAEAFTMEIAGNRIGLGSWMYGLIKMAAEVGAIAVDEPESLIVWNSRHPIVRFARSKMGAGLSLVAELATGRNFYGQEFEGVNDYLLRIAASLTPISAQPLVEKTDLGKPKDIAGLGTALAAQALGMRSFPYTLRSQWTDDDVFKDYDKIPSSDIERKSKKMPYSRSEYRKKNPEVEAKLFITGQVYTISSRSAMNTVLQLIEEHKLDPDTISGIKRNKEEQVKREELGVPDTTLTYTDKLVNSLGDVTRPSGDSLSRMQQIRGKMQGVSQPRPIQPVQGGDSISRMQDIREKIAASGR